MKNIFTFRPKQLLTITAILSLLISSCQKQEAVIPETKVESSSTDPLVKSAIEWYTKHSQVSKERSSKDFDLNNYRPDWGSVVVSKNSRGIPIVNVKLINQDEYYADSRFMELSVAVDQSGQSVALIKEFLSNPHEANAKTNLYTGDGNFIVSGEYDRSAGQLQKLSTMSASTSCSTNPSGGTSGSSGSGNVGPCNDDGSDPSYGGWLEEVVITDDYPGGPNPYGPEIPSPVTNPGTVIPVIPGGGGGGGVDQAIPGEGFQPLCISSIVLTDGAAGTKVVNFTGIKFGITDPPLLPGGAPQTNVITFNLQITVPSMIANPENPGSNAYFTDAQIKDYIYESIHYASQITNAGHGQDFFGVGAQATYSQIFAANVNSYFQFIALQGKFRAYENQNGLPPPMGGKASTMIDPSKATPARYTTSPSGKGC